MTAWTGARSREDFARIGRATDPRRRDAWRRARSERQWDAVPWWIGVGCVVALFVAFPSPLTLTAVMALVPATGWRFTNTMRSK